MPFVNVKLVESVFSGEEKHAMAALSEVTVRFEGLEAFREIVRVVREEPHTDGCHIGGEPFRGPAGLMDHPVPGKAAHESISGHPVTRPEPLHVHEETRR